MLSVEFGIRYLGSFVFVTVSVLFDYNVLQPAAQASKMLSWLPSIAYSDPTGGYWDPVTSTINWCEEVCSHKKPLGDPTDSYAHRIITRLRTLPK